MSVGLIKQHAYDKITVYAPSVQRRKVWLTLNTGVPCSNAAKTRNPLKLAGVPQSTGPISAASGRKFTRAEIGQVIILLPCGFFFFFYLFSSPNLSRGAQHVLDLHLKFALRPHDVWKYGRHPICDG